MRWAEYVVHWIGREIKMDIKEAGWENAEWIHLAYGKSTAVNTVMELKVQ
jgi:hypothetical protein